MSARSSLGEQSTLYDDEQVDPTYQLLPCRPGSFFRLTHKKNLSIMASVTPNGSAALPVPTSVPAVTNGDVEMAAPSANGDDEEDPNKIPDNAVETLYIHNLNESVRIPGQHSHPLRLPAGTSSR